MVHNVKLFLVVLVSCCFVARIEARFGVLNPPQNPSFADGPLCWSAEPEIMQGCHDSVTMKFEKFPPLNIAANSTGITASVSLSVSPEYLKTWNVANLGEVSISPLKVWFCPLNLGLCQPRQRRSEFAFLPQTGNNKMNRDGNRLVVDYEFEVPSTSGAYSILAEITMHSVHYVVAVNRTILDTPLTSPLVADIPKYQSAKCALADETTGSTFGSILATTLSSGLQLKLNLNSPISSKQFIRILEFGDKDQVMGQNELLHIEYSERCSSNEVQGSGCIDENLFSLNENQQTYEVIAKQLELNGANSVLGRLVELRDQTTLKRTAWCVFGEPEAAQPEVIGIPIPSAQGLSCSVSGSSLTGLITVERFDNLFDSDLVGEDNVPTMPTRSRVNVFLESKNKDHWGKANVLLRVKSFITPKSGQYLVNGGSVNVDTSGIAIQSLLLDTLAQGVYPGDVLELLVSYNGKQLDDVQGSCTVGRAPYGFEEPRPHISLRTGPVPQATAAACVMQPGLTGNRSGPNPRVTGFIRVKDSMNKGIQLSYGLAGFDAEVDQVFHLSFRESGDVSNPVTNSMGDVYRGSGSSKNFRIRVEVKAGQKQVFGSHYFETFRIMGDLGVLGLGVSLDPERYYLPVSQCVLGRAHGAETPQGTVEFPGVESGACLLQPMKISVKNSNKVAGLIYFQDVVKESSVNTLLTYSIMGINPGAENRWEIHDFGEMDASLSLLGNLYQGKNTLRYDPPCTKDLEGDRECLDVAAQLGNVLGTGVLTASNQGLAAGQALDEAIALNGKNSVIGRSLVVYTVDVNGQKTARASCTIGRGSPPLPTHNQHRESLRTSSPKYVTRAPTTPEARNGAADKSSGTTVIIVLLLLVLAVGGVVFARKSLKHKRFAREMEEFSNFDGLGSVPEYNGSNVGRIPPPPPRGLERMSIVSS